MRSSFLVTFIFFISLTSGLFSQPIKLNNGDIGVPKSLNTYPRTELLHEIFSDKLNLQTMKFETSEPWQVYSDRESNYTSENLDGTSNFKKLEMFERLTVKAISKSGNFLNVYGKLNGREVNKGWIHASKLILSKWAVVDSSTFMPKKAMVLITLSEQLLEMIKHNRNIELYKAFKSPDQNSSFTYLRKFEIYYVIKEFQDFKLLAKVDNLKDDDPAIQIVGWTRNLDLTPWSSRLCLEFSSESRSVAAYSGFRDSIYVYPREEYLTNAFANGNYNDYFKIRSRRLVSKRLSNEIPRMPVLDQKINGNYNFKRVATVGSIGNSNEVGNASIVEKLKRNVENLKNLNIFFIVDATATMEPYKEGIAATINDLMDRLRKESNGVLNIKFGLTTYKHYLDGKDSLKIIPLTNDERIISNYMLNLRCGSKNTKSPYESMHMGLYHGLKGAGFRSKDESNVAILIGDCGNDPFDKKYEINDIIDELVEKKVNLITFQVASGSNRAYYYFNSTALQLLKKSAMRQTSGNVVFSELQGSNATVKKLVFNYSKNESSERTLYGRYIYAKDRQMNSAYLSSQLREFVLENEKRIKEIRRDISNLSNTDPEEYSQSMIDYLKSIGYTDNNIQAIKTLGGFSFIGYTAMKFYNADYEAYTRVVYLSQNEVASLAADFGLLVNSKLSIDERKKTLSDVLVNLLLKAYGGSKSPALMKIIEEKTLDEVWRQLFGFPFTLKMTTSDNIKIGDLKISAINTLSDSDTNILFKNFEAKAESFSNDIDKYSFTQFGGAKFFWLPLSKLPGNN